jgi:hypothetical protein
VSALIAIDEASENEIPIISIRHFECARLIGLQWLKSSIALLNALGSTEFQHDCDAVLETIRISPNGIKLSDLYRKHRRLKKRDFDQILEALKDQEEIVIPEPDDKTKGRPAMMIFLNGTSTR